MKIIVTGGSGFLGRHLCRALSKHNHSIKNIDLVKNPEFETVMADVRDQKRMLEEIRDADLVFHLASLIEAGESVKHPFKFVDYNINGTLSVLEAMRQNGIANFIFSSSAAVYGEPQQVPIKEDYRTIPINPYGMTKLAMEGLLASYVEAHEFTGVALRYFNLYGPEEHHQPETHAIPRFIDQIANDKEVTIWGDGSHRRDFVFISDIVEAHIKALDLVERKPKQYHYMNLSNQQPASVSQVVKLIEEVMGKTANVTHFPERPGDPKVLVADAGKAKRLLDWQAEVELKEGLQKTVEYFMSL